MGVEGKKTFFCSFNKRVVGHSDFSVNVRGEFNDLLLEYPIHSVSFCDLRNYLLLERISILGSNQSITIVCVPRVSLCCTSVTKTSHGNILGFWGKRNSALRIVFSRENCTHCANCNWEQRCSKRGPNVE